MKIKRYCINCKKEITSGSKLGRCKSCAKKYTYKNSKNHPCYKDGKTIKIYNCKSCNKIITWQSAINGSGKCRRCINKEIMNKKENNWMYGRRGKDTPGYWIRGNKCHFWKGGISKLTFIIRHSYKYRQWRDDVFTRDNFICQKCFIKGGYLHSHHIESFSDIISKNNIKTIFEAEQCAELWNINNGITLHKDCHYYLHRKNNASN